jgi:hypothetical protein
MTVAARAQRGNVIQRTARSGRLVSASEVDSWRS